ncbi:alkylated DNA repair protein alkB homolog 8 [Sabethes cyaneus]|uniref:alkylated DNA repair protein alkB homolog 8 n=1 Tax=Sabethes cyaneus TaxID=53552 RepID=UPI00237EB0F1|nr:alkylated DNA repair protein alkB homolog 8 [Sabethes cyaneus]
MLSKKLKKKIQKKINRCQIIISNETGLQFTDAPTENIVICNAGLATGLQQETLLEEVLRHVATSSLENVAFPTGKSYCSLRFKSTEMAQVAYEAMNGIAPLGQDGCVLLMAYSSRELVSDDAGFWKSDQLPPGLILIPDFVGKQLESELLELIECTNDEKSGGSLKHRRVQHFGYEFLYGSNNVDKSKPLDRAIPAICDLLWPKLYEKYPMYSWFIPDQLTVNCYEPGQGIPPHVDTHSAFRDPIISLSLGSEILMEFRDTRGNHLNVDLPRGSLLIMSGESRYGWTHGITPRKMDTVRLGNSLTVRKRGFRVSYTFRKLQDVSCQCQFSSLCDTFKQEAEIRKQHLQENAAQLEQENVHKVYNEIAKHFSETRHSPWPRVLAFLNSLPVGSIMLDVGCGNGKYLSDNERITGLGCDRSDELLKVCTSRGLNVLQCDCLALPFRSASVDACISIAVIHHLATDERRQRAITEMGRVLRPEGRALIYVWAKNQAANAKQSSYLRQNKRANRSQQQQFDASETLNETDPGAASTVLPVHTNRTQFQHQDLLVPWKLRDLERKEHATKATFLRYYHVFEEGELERLCGTVPQLSVEESYYDQGNWCVVLRKNC